MKFKFKVSKWKFRHLSVIDKKIIGVVKTETELWFFEKGVRNSKTISKSKKIQIWIWEKDIFLNGFDCFFQRQKIIFALENH
jgi:hypothetical protein